jgi:hypothetical protein
VKHLQAIPRIAPIGGLPLPKVLKNMINHLFSARIDYYMELRLQDGSFSSIVMAYEVKI